jgi:hypothetical protein
VIAQQPQFSRTRQPRIALIRRRQDVLFVVAGHRHGDVDLAHLEAADAEIDLAADLQHFAEFQLQGLGVPAGLFAQAIEREPQQPQFSLVEIADDHGWSLGKAHLASGEDETPTGDDSTFGVDHQRKHEADFLKAFC